MTVNQSQFWANCNDGHTTFAGLNVDTFRISELCKWNGVIRSVNIKDVEAEK